MYPASILFTGAVSVVYALEQSKFVIPIPHTGELRFLPGYGAGLGWIVPHLQGWRQALFIPRSQGEQEE